MSTYLRDAYLQLRIRHAIQQWKSPLVRDIVVTAFMDGTVCLRGIVYERKDCTELEEFVCQLPGVACVFCNVGVKS